MTFLKVLDTHRPLGDLVPVLLVFPVRALELEHLEDAGPGVQPAVPRLAAERLDLQPEGDAALPAVLLGRELGRNAMYLGTIYRKFKEGNIVWHRHHFKIHKRGNPFHF